MKKNDQIIFAALLAAVFVLLSMTLSAVIPTKIEVSGSIADFALLMNAKAEMLGLEEAISSADYVFTGEGKFDRQSLAGKLPVGIARICSKYNKPLFLVTGKIDNVTKEEIKVTGISDFIELNNNPHDKSPFSYAREIIVEEVSKLMKNKGIL